MKSKHPITNQDEQTTNQESDAQNPEPANSEGHGGPQGVDKAPGEDPPDAPGSDNKRALKGKKEDGDPSLEKDKPVEKE
ncbi:MAG: hypothetical protein JO301_04165 [Chitinophagaceae bacterium]|nr:hypothetical protein [Chitinophagaceae bacterium]